MIAWPEIRKIRRRRQIHRAPGHRRIGDQQGQECRLEPRRPDARRAAEPAGLRQAQRLQARLVRNGMRHCAELRSKYAMNYDRDSALIQPYYVIEEINRLTQGEAIITTGVGQHQMWAAQYFDFRSPRLWLTSGSMGTMGFGLPAAVGAQFAQRKRLGHRHRRRRQHPHEHRRARDRHHLRVADQSAGVSTIAATAWSSNGRSCSTRAA
jgi:hypothetical protein